MCRAFLLSAALLASCYTGDHSSAVAGTSGTRFLGELIRALRLHRVVLLLAQDPRGSDAAAMVTGQKPVKVVRAETLLEFRPEIK